MNDSDRIKLAEFCGWERREHDNGSGGTFHYWYNPHVAVSDKSECPSPDTDANDCEALIRALRKEGWLYHREDWATRTMQQFYRTRATSWKNDSWWGDPNDYKIGVCELALKVITADRGQEET